MSRTIFVAPIGSDVGKTTFCLGLIFNLKKIAAGIGFMKPIGRRYREHSGVCEDMRLIADACGIDPKCADDCMISVKDLEKRLLAGEEKQVLNDIAVAHEKVLENRDVVVVEGMDLTSMSACQTNVNVAVARRLNAQVLLLISGAADRSVEDVVYETVRAKEIYESPGCRVLGVVINKANPDTLLDYANQLKTAFKPHKMNVAGVIPYLPIMGAASMRDITNAINGTIVIEGDMRKLAYDFIVGAMQPHNMLAHLGDNTLVITPGDRDDMLLAVAIADMADTRHSIAGLILTGNLNPSDVILDLVRKLRDRDFPIILTKHDTFKTVTIVNNIDSHICMDDKEKIEAAEMIIETHCDCQGIFTASGVACSREKRPQDYLDDLISRAKQKMMHVVLSEGTDERVIRAAGHIQNRNIANITLLGNPDFISDKAKQIGVALRKVNIIDPAEADIDAYAEQLHEIRKHKGLGIHAARDLMRDDIYYSAMMVHTGDADGFVSGAVHSTADTLRPALQVIGTAPGVKFISSVFMMLKGSKAFFYGDCAIIENPDMEQLATIAVSSARTAESFGITPIVAMLSYSTGQSGKGASVEKVREAASLAAKIAPDMLIEGPVQYDAAFDAEVARVKMPDSKVAGRANVFIFPDLNSGNIAYKAVQREAGAAAIGPICQGFRKPVNDLSRGCSMEDIVYVAAITAIQAQQQVSAAEK